MKLKIILTQLTDMVNPDRTNLSERDRRAYDRSIDKLADCLINTAADSVNSFSVDTVRLVDEIGDGKEFSFMKKVAMLWTSQWGAQEALELTDDRNIIAVRKCQTLASTEEFEMAYDAEDAFSEEWRVASICASASKRMHRTLMQQFTGVIFRILSKAGITQADTSRLPMI